MIRCILKDTQNILLLVHALINFKKLNFTLYIVTKIKVLFEYFKQHNGSFLCVIIYFEENEKRNVWLERKSKRKYFFDFQNFHSITKMITLQVFILTNQ